MNDIRLPWKDWRIVKKIGGGSFGAVYEIERELFGDMEKAALKVIQVPHDPSEYKELTDSGFDLESINSRFYSDLSDIVNEYKLMAQLKGNANIIHCEDLQYMQNENGIGYLLFIRMELLHPMTDALTFPPDDSVVIRLGTDLCNALSGCRKHNIIHRDIKPANILADADGRFKLGDFGVSKTADRTAGGTKTGTFNYMAPEVYNNQPYNQLVDIYSLGMVLYWMLNRRTAPFLPLPPEMPTARQAEEARNRRFSGETLPLPADGSTKLKAVVRKACAFKPSDRYQSPEEFAAALRSCANAAAPVKQPEPAVGSASFRDETAATQRTLGNSWDSTAAGTVGTAAGMAAGATVGAEPKPQPSAPAPAPAPQPVSAPPVRQPEPSQSFSESTMGNSWECDSEETVGTVGAAYAGKTVGAPGVKTPKPAPSDSQKIDWTASERTHDTGADTPKNGIWDKEITEKVYVSLEKAISGGISRLDNGKEIQIPPYSRPFSQQTLSRVSDQGLRQLYRAVERRLFDAGPLAKVVAVVAGLCLLIWKSTADIFKMINLQKTGSAIGDGVFAALCLALLIFLLWKRPGFFDDVDLLNRYHRWKRRQELEPEMIRRNLLQRPAPVSMPKLFASFALTALFAIAGAVTAANYDELPRRNRGNYVLIILGSFGIALVCVIWLIVNICKLISVKRMEAKFKKYGSGKRY